jgi:hypothetical protein
MSGARRAFASRANGRLGNAKRTAAGKARQAAAARCHGLSLPVLLDAALAPEIDTLARAIVATSPGVPGDHPHDDARLALACRVAEAMIDLRRVRLAKRPLSIALDADPGNMATLEAFARLDRYEARALSRRKFAIRAFAAAIAGSDPARPLRLRRFRIRAPRANFGSVT